MGNFYPLKTRVFSAVRPLVQNIAEMTNFQFLEPPEFTVHIYCDLIFLILISKSNQLFRGFIIKKGEFTEANMYS